MELPSNIVLANGRLNDVLILKKETLYTGMNGRHIERFYLTPSQSFIFKPLTHDGQLGKEVWVHEQILPLFPAIYPKILSYSISENPDFCWLILEDLGQLRHDFNEKIVLDVAKWAAWWHSIPLEKLENVPLTGQKPQFAKIATDIFVKKDEFFRLLPLLDLEEAAINSIYRQLDRFIFSQKLVLSHGDLHAGNFAVVDQKLMILDWEHTHLNTPYWDLYHLIDMSHPLFPKKMKSEIREKIMTAYLGAVRFELNHDAFVKEYYLYSAVFSIWMIMLIQKDIQGNGGKWPIDQLKTQLQETVSNLKQCLTALL